MKKIEERDTDFAPALVSNGLKWYDIRELGIEGCGWNATATPYDRLPARAQGVVREPVWLLSQHSAGLCVRFVSDAPSIRARWSLRFDSLAMNHMPASGVSGLDLFAMDGCEWRWLGVGRPSAFPVNEELLAGALCPGRRQYLLYLPLYNGVDSVFIGIPEDASLSRAPGYPETRRAPICFYGTSIVQGGCASRPGMAYPALLGRRLGRPTLNLGFSGNGQAEPEMARLLAELDPCVYVLDPLPNLSSPQILERMGPLVETLREAHPLTPIVLVGTIAYQDAWLVMSRAKRERESRAELEDVYRRLEQKGVGNLYRVAGEDLLGHDGLGTVDGTHPTDVGFLRMAEAIEPLLRRALQQGVRARKRAVNGPP